MLPSMPILFSISRDSLLEEQQKPIHTIRNRKGSATRTNPQKKGSQLTIPNEIPNFTFSSFPEGEKECDDELVLLAENSPFAEKRKLLSQSTAKRKRKVDVAQLLNEDKNVIKDQAEHFASAYFMKLKGELDDQTFRKFIALLSDINEENFDIITLYQQISDILLGYPELLEQFIGFLNPTQAHAIGKLTEYLSFKQIWNSFKKLDAFHFNKLNHLLEQHSTNSNISYDIVRSSLHSSFKGHPNITEGILALLPEGKFTPNCKEDFEDISELASESNEWETLCVHDSISKGCIPGECECVCHSCTPKKFCTFCNIKFLKGQIFVQTGKGLRFAKVIFCGSHQEEVLMRLHPTYYNKPTSCKRTKSNIPNHKETRCEVESILKSDIPPNEFIKDSVVSTDNVHKNSSELEVHPLDEDDEIQFLEKQLNSDNLNFDEPFIVSEDVIIESTNSEVEDMEYDSGDEFNMETSPTSVKHDDDSANSFEVLEEKTILGEGLSNADDINSCSSKFNFHLDSENGSIHGSSSSESTKNEYKLCNDDKVANPEVACKTDKESKVTNVWTREEDKLILQAFRKQLGTEQTFSEISEQLPSRSVDDIQGRFQVLMNLLEKMTSGSYDVYPT